MLNGTFRPCHVRKGRRPYPSVATRFHYDSRGMRRGWYCFVNAARGG